MRIRGLAAVAAAGALALVGCGGEERITGDDKREIGRAALNISVECMGGDADIAAVEDSITTLLNARDDFGDQRFTISDELADVNVQDLIDRQRELMERENCAPEQQERLS